MNTNLSQYNFFECLFSSLATEAWSIYLHLNLVISMVYGGLVFYVTHKIKEWNKK